MGYCFAIQRVTEIRRAGEWNIGGVTDRVVLDSGDRHRRRAVLTGERGTALLMDWPQPVMLRDGDGLVLDGGGIVQVIGEPEPLIEIAARTSLALVRLAWHLGNRHTDVQISGDRLRIRRDHVLEEMAAGLDASIAAIEAPFDPESGAPHDDGRDHGVDGGSPGALYRLMTWLSPSYPVGAFSYSSGIEWAVEASDIKDAASLRRWLAVVLGQGGGFCDAVFFVHAYRSLADSDDRALRAVAELAAAFAPSKERHLETTAQGAAFIEATSAAWPCAALDRLKKAWNGPVAYPVAVGVAAAGHSIALEPALQAFLHAVTANLISAGVRLVPLGQTDGQRVLAALEPVVQDTARRAQVTPLEEVGSAAFRADLASLRHETQYTRLFRS
jgi:urease accessory protein